MAQLVGKAGLPGSSHNCGTEPASWPTSEQLGPLRHWASAAGAPPARTLERRWRVGARTWPRFGMVGGEALMTGC
jgi:hypothetical protein